MLPVKKTSQYEWSVILISRTANQSITFVSDTVNQISEKEKTLEQIAISCKFKCQLHSSKRLVITSHCESVDSDIESCVQLG